MLSSRAAIRLVTVPTRAMVQLVVHKAAAGSALLDMDSRLYMRGGHHRSYEPPYDSRFFRIEELTPCGGLCISKSA